MLAVVSSHLELPLIYDHAIKLCCFSLQETQSKITTLMKKATPNVNSDTATPDVNSDTASPGPNDNTEATDQPTSPDTQHGK